MSEDWLKRFKSSEFYSKDEENGPVKRLFESLAGEKIELTPIKALVEVRSPDSTNWENEYLNSPYYKAAVIRGNGTVHDRTITLGSKTLKNWGKRIDRYLKANEEEPTAQGNAVEGSTVEYASVQEEFKRLAEEAKIDLQKQSNLVGAAMEGRNSEVIAAIEAASNKMNKTNVKRVVMLGNTGIGKSFLADKLLKVSFAIATLPLTY
jgi:hypothetical protein